VVLLLLLLLLQGTSPLDSRLQATCVQTAHSTRSSSGCMFF
jgi:hypothetical protein